MKENEIDCVVREVVSAVKRTADAGLPYHSHRPYHFLSLLGMNLRIEYAEENQGDVGIGVTAKWLQNDIPGLDVEAEFVFDLHVFEYCRLQDPLTGRPVCHVTGSIIQLETDFRKDSLRSAMTKLNKLMIGNADLKIFMISRQEDEKTMSVWKEFCKGAALNAGCSFLLFILPDLSGWGPATMPDDEIEIYTLRTDPDSYGLIPYVQTKE